LEVVDLAEAQHGVVTRKQLLDLQMGREAIQRQLQAGRLHRVHAGVYSLGHRLLTVQGRWMAAVLASGEGGALSHRSAAAHWGIAPIPAGSIDVLVPRRTRSGRKGINVHRVRTLDPRDRTVRDGIRVTTVGRTLFDFAEVVNPRQLRNAFEEAERRRLLDVRAIERLCESGTGRSGLRPLRALIADRTAPPDTKPGLEREFCDFCDEYEVRRPAFNVAIGPYVVDALWVKERLIVELDSRAFHDYTAAFERDRARDINLQVWGYRVLRVTAKHRREAPAELAAAILALLAAA
jgi:very-short-patch-repair endonuclease